MEQLAIKIWPCLTIMLWASCGLACRRFFQPLSEEISADKQTLVKALQHSVLSDHYFTGLLNGRVVGLGSYTSFLLFVRKNIYNISNNSE
jgi:hypothetical protein